MAVIPNTKVVIECSEELAAQLNRIERNMAFRPAWLCGPGALGRYIGTADRQGRKALAWARAEGIKSKSINGTAHFSISDVDRAMRNGRSIETR